ncbi:MAG: MmgE/PrpD family protein [Deltaproteobacteria bacterium]|nr:MmgE/PrpD family protein [Deltaproteobacteria bacterium]
MSATERLAEFACGLSLEKVPESARESARAAMLDAVACAIAGRDERVTRELRGFALEQGSYPRASLWGTGERVSPALAALVNGAAAHALDFDDVSWAMNGHPTVPLLPAAFALAEALGRSGAELMLAYVAGFEVQARLGQALGKPHYERGWHATSTLGVFGATAASGVLLGLDAGALRRAFGIATSRAAGTRGNFGTDAKPLHAGLAARAGLEAAELARRSVTARPDALEMELGLADLYGGARPLELPPLDAGFALDDPGVELKPYPSCRFTHRAIDAVLALREKHEGRELRAIECASDPLGLSILIYPEPHTGLEAKFSLQYCVAIAWLSGWPGLDAFSDARAAADDVQALLRRVSVRATRSADEEVELIFSDGTRARQSVRIARGHPQNPLSDAHREAKLALCLEPALGVQRARALIDSFSSLETLRDVRELAGRLA